MSNAILLVDLLGVKARWYAGGRKAADLAFKRFADLVASTLRDVPAPSIVTGIVETDAVAATLNNVDEAVTVATNLFRRAFTSKLQDGGERFWLRGVIARAPDGVFLRRLVPLANGINKVEKAEYSSELLDALAVEKSGIKGMRLLIDESLLTPKVRGHHHVQIGPGSVDRFHKLRLSSYPSSVAGQFADVLWMATPDENEWEAWAALMVQRVSRSARRHEEFVHAAATQVLFHECGARFARVKRRHGMPTPRLAPLVKAALNSKARPNQRLQPTARTLESVTRRG